MIVYDVISGAHEGDLAALFSLRELAEQLDSRSSWKQVMVLIGGLTRTAGEVQARARGGQQIRPF